MRPPSTLRHANNLIDSVLRPQVAIIEQIELVNPNPALTMGKLLFGDE